MAVDILPITMFADFRHGKDVFLEKPMAMSADEGLTIKKAADANNKLVMVGHMWRFDTDVNYGNYDVDDSGIILISWDNGAESIIESGWW